MSRKLIVTVFLEALRTEKWPAILGLNSMAVLEAAWASSKEAHRYLQSISRHWWSVLTSLLCRQARAMVYAVHDQPQMLGVGWLVGLNYMKAVKDTTANPTSRVEDSGHISHPWAHLFWFQALTFNEEEKTHSTRHPFQGCWNWKMPGVKQVTSSITWPSLWCQNHPESKRWYTPWCYWLAYKNPSCCGFLFRTTTTTKHMEPTYVPQVKMAGHHSELMINKVKEIKCNAHKLWNCLQEAVWFTTHQENNAEAVANYPLKLPVVIASERHFEVRVTTSRHLEVVSVWWAPFVSLGCLM